MTHTESLPLANLETFVDVKTAAEFLAVTPRYLLEQARHGRLPAHPLGAGLRRLWRFRLSELADTVGKNVVIGNQAVLGS